MAKYAPMKNTATSNTNKKQNYTFTKNQKRLETIDIRQVRKLKQKERLFFSDMEAV